MKVKFLAAHGKWKKDEIADLTDEERQSLDVAGLVKEKDWDEWIEDPADARKLVAEEIAKADQAYVDERKSLTAEMKTQREQIRVIHEPEDHENRGFRGIGDFGRSVYLAGHESVPVDSSRREILSAKTRLEKCEAAEARAVARAVGSDELSTTTGAYGAWLVPTEYRKTLINNSLQFSQVRQYITEIPMEGAALTMPAVKDEDHSSHQLYGGITVYMVSEMAQKTATRPQFKGIELDLKEAVVMIAATKKLLKYSAFALEPMLGTMAANTLGWFEDWKILRGTGAGEPKGMLNAACKIQVVRSGAANTVVDADIRNMWCRIPPQLRRQARWLGNGDIEPQLWAMNIASGTAGYLTYIPAGGRADTPYSTLMGRPFEVTEHLPALGTEGDLMCIVPSAYFYAVPRGGIDAATSIHLRFDYNETMFRYEIELDGQCSWASEVTPHYGGNTFSPIVALQ